MKIRLYMDEDSMRHALVHALRARGVDVQTALEAGLIETPDVLGRRAVTATAEIDRR